LIGSNFKKIRRIPGKGLDTRILVDTLAALRKKLGGTNGDDRGCMHVSAAWFSGIFLTEVSFRE
jgi:hypothetical protein